MFPYQGEARNGGRRGRQTNRKGDDPETRGGTIQLGAGKDYISKAVRKAMVVRVVRDEPDGIVAVQITKYWEKASRKYHEFYICVRPPDTILVEPGRGYNCEPLGTHVNVIIKEWKKWEEVSPYHGEMQWVNHEKITLRFHMNWVRENGLKIYSRVAIRKVGSPLEDTLEITFLHGRPEEKEVGERFIYDPQLLNDMFGMSKYIATVDRCDSLMSDHDFIEWFMDPNATKEDIEKIQKAKKKQKEKSISENIDMKVMGDVHPDYRI